MYLLVANLYALIDEVNIASGLHDVNLAAGGPDSVLLPQGQHPDSRPYPVTRRGLGPSL